MCALEGIIEIVVLRGLVEHLGSYPFSTVFNGGPVVAAEDVEVEDQEEHHLENFETGFHVVVLL